jgi:hypothetical protein
MKTQSKPIVALASGALLLCGVLCQSAHAQAIILGPTTVDLADVNGTDSGPDALPVTYEVTQFTSGPYTGLYDYSYIVSPSAAEPAYVLGFEVEFNAAYSGAVVGTPTGGLASQNSEYSGITWATFIAPGETPDANDTLTFMSDQAPILGNANASGSAAPGPWASAPDGQQVAVPYTPAVPEPATTSLLAMALLIPTFARGIFRPRNVKN